MRLEKNYSGFYDYLEMKNTFKLFTLSVLILCFFSCKVEFSPNATWTETPIVYCLLDQDDDTTYIRVQKAYLGEGNQYDFAQIIDSINYPQGSIEVKLLGWKSKLDNTGLPTRDLSVTAPVQEFIFDYTILTDKVDGSFSAPNQPVYYYPTKNLLDTNFIYQLIITHQPSGDTIATAETYLIKNYSSMTTMLTKPNNINEFQFSGTSKVCEFQWYTLPFARQYQPHVIFHYHDFYRHFNGIKYDTILTPHTVRINCPKVKSNLNSPALSCRLDRQTFLTTVKESIQARNIDWALYEADTNTDFSLVVDKDVDIYINAANEDLAAYLYSQQITGGINQDSYNYTNIKGGLGIFAARRTHIQFTVPSNTAARSNYMSDIKDLGIGF